MRRSEQSSLSTHSNRVCPVAILLSRVRPDAHERRFSVRRVRRQLPTARVSSRLHWVTLPLLRPMLATTGARDRDLAGWCTEAKWDGWRALVYIDGGLKVRTRSGRQVSDSLPELVGLVDALDGQTSRSNSRHCVILCGGRPASILLGGANGKRTG